MGRAITVIRDLIFSSKISASARAAGVGTKSVSTASALEAELSAGDVSLVIVDMSLALDEAVAALRCSASHASKPTTLAFYSHVQSELRDAAKAAGADLILPRSAFNEQLQELLMRYTGGKVD